MAEIAERFFRFERLIGNCPVTDSDTGWGATFPGSPNCAAVTPTFQNGIELSSGRLFDFEGTTHASSCMTQKALGLVGSRMRETICPNGYTATLENGETICSKKNDQTCPVGNPAQPGSGNKVLRQADIAPTAASPLRFKRTYNSFPYIQPRTATGSLHAPLGPNWRGTYDQRIILVANSLSVSAIAMRDDGSVKYFGLSGEELQHDQGARETLDTLSPGWRYTRADDSVELYNADGRLTTITYRDGRNITVTYDADSRIAEVADHTGRTLTFSYRLGFLEAIADSAGAIVEYTFDQIGNLREVAYPGTATARKYEYNWGPYSNYKTLLTRVTDENGDWHAEYTYGDGLLLKTSTLAPALAGGTINKHTFTYGAGTTTVDMPTGSSAIYGITTTADGVLRVGSLSEPCPQCGGASQSTTYDAGGYRDLVTDFNGTVTDYDHDARGLETQRVEANEQGGNSSLPEKRTTQTDWHATFRQPVERRTYDAANTLIAKSQWTYNTRGQGLTSTQTDPATSATRTTTYAYCEAADVADPTTHCPVLGQLKSVNGPRTDVSDLTTYTYFVVTDVSGCAGTGPCHRKGDLWKVTNALGHVSEILRYDGAGRVRASKDANGVITEFTYHPRGWLLTRTVKGALVADDAVTAYAYDATGQVTRVTQPDGDFLDYEYDDAHRLTAIEDALGNRIDYTLDAAGNRTAEVTKDANAAITRQLTRVYDQLGRLDQQLDSQDRATDFAYDAIGNQTAIEDALDIETRQEYDPLNRLKATIQDYAGLNAETGYTYDSLDRLVTVTDPKGLDTDYTYDGLGNLTELDSPDTGVTTYTYDAAGNRLTQTDARGITATHTYDALNRLTGITYLNSSLNVTFQYDQTNGTTGCPLSFPNGRLTRMLDASGSTTYCYDRRGQIAHKTQQTTGGVTLGYTASYSPDGRLLQRAYHPRAGFSNLVLQYAYDDGGRLEAITATSPVPAPCWECSTPSKTVAPKNDCPGSIFGVPCDLPMPFPLVHDFVYSPFGPINRISYADGVTVTRNYDLDGRLTSFGDGVGPALDLAFGHDAVGNPTALTGEEPERHYAYDPLSRLTDIEDANAALLEAFTYDATGNRLSKQVGVTSQTYIYPSDSHRLTQIDAVTRNFDAAGNTTGIGTRVLAYDARGRLATVHEGATLLQSQQYNGKGERVSRAAIGLTRQFLYDEVGRLIQERNSNGAERYYVHVGDLPVAVLDTPADGELIIGGPTVTYLEPDTLGTPRAARDAGGTRIWHWPLSGGAFGDGAPLTDPDADSEHFTLDLRYPGQYYDQESGTHYNYQRDGYEAGTGRYTQSDPIGLEGGISSYSYAGANPLSFSDPKGLDYWVEGAYPTESGLGKHESICVGTYGGSRFCISFGRKPGQGDCWFNCDGHTYVDKSPPGIISYPHFRGTDSATDAKIKAYLKARLNEERDWSVVFGENCRVFSQNVFWHLDGIHGGTPAPPPPVRHR